MLRRGCGLSSDPPGGKQVARIRHLAQAAWLAQSGHLIAWVPVLLAIGIGGYFALPVEPQLPHYALAATLALGGATLAVRGARRGALLAPLIWVPVLIALGGGLAGLRAHNLAEPVLGWRYYGPIEGRVVALDRSGSDALRVTLDRVVLHNLAPARTPARVRVSLHGDQGFVTPAPGMRLILSGHLSPPSGPVEPGGFDFQRHAWFQQIGAVGYTRTPVLAIEPPGTGQLFFKARMALSAHVQARLPDEAGAFAAAIMAGDRAGLGRDTLEVLRVTNLAHLLAISGLHMGLVAGFVFAALRLLFATLLALGLQCPAKKLAAALALVVAAGYLGLSGGNVATERAFVMVAVVLVAVMLDQRAISLRSVAVAATIVLVWQPEALLGPGFQMSFAATTALVAVYGLIRDAGLPMGPRWLRPISAVVITSVVAGLATAPLSAAHFNLWSSYGLLANITSVPLMGVLIMPAAVLGTLLIPLGLDAPVFTVMGLGLDWILGVAHWVSGLDGARGTVPAPGPVVLPMMALGALFTTLWQGRARLAGAVPVALSLLLWSQAGRPDVLISDSGALVGVMTGAGRALSRPRGGGFVAENWLENDGDATTQADAAARWNAHPASPIALHALRGKRAAEALTNCGPSEWVVLDADVPESRAAQLPCMLLTPRTLRNTGSVALYTTDGGVRMVTAREITGTRLWTPQ